MFKFLQTDTFDILFSFILGVGCMAVLKPACKGAECQVRKAPPYEDIQASTYQIGGSCYQFKAEPVECTESGIIEPFQRFVR
jgi:hypothetical protein